MKETDCQKLVIDVVRERGGAGHKLSNRFLVGVADLLVKLPGYRAALIEVKLECLGRTTKVDHEFTLAVTPLQIKFLASYAAAGMACGVMSFIEVGGRGKLGLRVAMFSLDNVVRRRYRTVVGEHAVCDEADDRADYIVRAIQILAGEE